MNLRQLPSYLMPGILVAVAIHLILIFALTSNIKKDEPIVAKQEQVKFRFSSTKSSATSVAANAPAVANPLELLAAIESDKPTPPTAPAEQVPSAEPVKATTDKKVAAQKPVKLAKAPAKSAEKPKPATAKATPAKKAAPAAKPKPFDPSKIEFADSKDIKRFDSQANHLNAKRDKLAPAPPGMKQRSVPKKVYAATKKPAAAAPAASNSSSRIQPIQRKSSPATTQAVAYTPAVATKTEPMVIRSIERKVQPISAASVKPATPQPQAPIKVVKAVKRPSTPSPVIAADSAAADAPAAIASPQPPVRTIQRRMVRPL